MLIKISGCDASVTMEIGITQGGMDLLKNIQTALDSSDVACRPGIEIPALCEWCPEEATEVINYRGYCGPCASTEREIMF